VPNDIDVEKFIRPSAKNSETGCTTTKRNTDESVRKTKTTRTNLQATNPKLIYSDSRHVRKLDVVENSESVFSMAHCGVVAYVMRGPCGPTLKRVLDLFPFTPNSGSPPLFFFFFPKDSSFFRTWVLPYCVFFYPPFVVGCFV
jgi:hypothetical protein